MGLPVGHLDLAFETWIPGERCSKVLDIQRISKIKREVLQVDTNDHPAAQSEARNPSSEGFWSIA